MFARNSSRKLTLGRHTTLAAIASALVASLLLLASANAQARPLKLAVQDTKLNGTSSAATANVALKISGARDAHSVALYVDGHLQQRDRAWPWNFGRNGKVNLRVGQHRIAVRARLRRRVQIRRKAVNIAYRSSRAHGPHKKAETTPSSPVTGTESPFEPTSGSGGSTFWHGDYETGDLSQWELVQRVAPDRITITGDPVRQGNYAARFEVRPGDNIGDTSTRAEVGADLGEREGEERYYRWYTYFDPSFPTEYPESFVTFTQWRADDESGSFGSFMLWGDQIELRREGTRWATPLTKGVWHKFVYHVKWSPDPNVGFIELWYDGQLVLPKVHVRTMAGSPGAAIGNYVKQGLYKADNIPTAVLYQDGFVAGTSFDEVNEAP